MAIHEIDVTERSINNVSELYTTAILDEDDSRTILPVAASEDRPAGILVVGGQKILYFEYSNTQEINKGKGKSRKSSLSPSRDPKVSKAKLDWSLSDLTA